MLATGEPVSIQQFLETIRPWVAQMSAQEVLHILEHFTVEGFVSFTQSNGLPGDIHTLEETYQAFRGELLARLETLKLAHFQGGTA